MCTCSALPVRPAEIAELQAASAMGQGRLYRTYDDLLREQGIATAQILLTFFDMSARTHYLNARRTLQTLLGWRVVPVINENDTTTTDEISFGDNDFLAAQVAVLLGAELLLLLTDTDGLYTANPRVDPGAKLVEEVADPTQLGGLAIGHERLAARLGRDALEGRRGGDGDRRGDPDGDRVRPASRACWRWRGRASATGTRFAPQAVRHSSFKLWLKYAKPSHGTLTVDAGAARALRDGGTSLLPVGIVDVAGEFDAGDAVEVREAGAAGIGKGIVNYSAPELRSVMGMKSAQVRERMPRATDEAVHRDYFVLA